MHPRDEFRMLDIYFGGYLHEDWADEFSHPDEAFEKVLSLLNVAELQQMAIEFGKVLDLPDAEMLRVLDLLSTHFDPRAGFGWDEREWLIRLRDRVRSELE